MSRILLAVLLIFTVLVFPSTAAGELTDLIGAYNSHDYRRAVQLGEMIIHNQPGNARARYYLANSYVGLKQMEQAQVQYKRCIELAPDSDLAQNSQIALKQITNYLSPAQTALQSGKNKKKHGDSHSNGSPQEQQLWNDAQNRIKMKERDANDQIEKIRIQANADISCIPRKIRRRRRNPDYAPAKAEIKAQAEAKISKIRRALDHDRQDILKDAEQRISGLK